jgi:hypothetical protein
MRLPEINLQELEKIKKENFKERLEFQNRYVKWMKTTGNVKWSAAQNALINRKPKNSAKPSQPNRAVKHTQNIRRRSKN